MSHFTVLVIGEDYESQLAPYHEFECTGVNDEWVQTLDITEKVREEYETDTVSRLKDEDGNLHEPWDDRFFREPTEEESKEVGFGSGWSGALSWTSRDWGDGKGYRAKVRFVPEGFEEVEVPRSEAETFLEFLEDYHGHKVVPFGDEPDIEGDHKYGYVLLDEKGDAASVFDRTNPNRKWDWYQVGGRWRGYFKTKEGARGEVGSPGTFGNEKTFDADVLRKGAVDVDGMRDEAGERVGSAWDRVNLICKDLPLAESWDEVRNRHTEGLEGDELRGTIEKAREEYYSQPRLEAIADHDKKARAEDRPDDVLIGWTGGVEQFQVEREIYVQRARDAALAPFSYVINGEWIEPGEMGWWGVSSDTEDSRIIYQQEFNKMFDALKDDVLLTLVDCHI